jgi:GTPase SAR1 family protein
MIHILGLSDAVDQAMINFKLKVNFPCTKTFPVVNWENPCNISRTFAKVCYRRGYPQLVIRAVRKSCTTKRRRFDLILHYLKVFPKGLREKEYVKMIKLSLAGTFSSQMDQELPEGFSTNSIPIFPAYTQKKLDAIFQGDLNKERRVQFYFNLLQSKALCAPVGEDMIKDAYESHCASICRPEEETIPLEPDLYLRLRAHAKAFFSQNCDYDPFRTSLPNPMSSVEANRKKGGNRQGLINNGTLRRSNRHPLIGMMEDTENSRMEPFVIGLFGQPASGKSTIVQRLLMELKQRIAPGFGREDFSYSRSCATKHWDGYRGQPVVVLDDFGQSVEDRSDLAEFMTLVSVNDYVLPMASLSEKGQKFRSPIVIVTSNMAFGIPNVRNAQQGVILEDTAALWRRFDLPLLVEKTRVGYFPNVTPYKLGCFNRRPDFYEKKHSSRSDTHLTPGYPLDGRGPPRDLNSFRTLGTPYPTFGSLVSRIARDVGKKFDFHNRTFHDSWTQVVHSYKVDYRKSCEGPIWEPFIEEVNQALLDQCDSITLDFPVSPPIESPRVKAFAIPEPLKVRMITIGEVDTKVLQPLQKALWGGLGRCPQFCLTNGVKDLEDFAEDTLPWIYRIESAIKIIKEQGDIREENPVWLSGDYTAATDNFPMWATEALLEGILDCISHEPTKQWARWEISSHKIDYPGRDPELQTSGQLMDPYSLFLCFVF